LRIAWSVLFAGACCIFFLLWVRSYWAIDHIDFMVKSQRIEGDSDRGQLWLAIYKAAPLPWVRPDNSPPPVFRTGQRFFRIQYGETGGIIFIPHRYLIALLVVCAGVPWISWSTRFSLRTLLIAISVAAILLALVMWLLSHQHSQ
jgi:hypothetical protein